ncbi:MAG TPA: ATP-binding protein [Terriglobales bacterium]|nr:ATP-binding protein [Terriglobales bacterium]
MSTLPTQAAPSDAIATLSDHWHDRLAFLVARGKRAAALAFLEKTVADHLPLFASDRGVFEARRSAWLIRTHLLLEWGRPAEALAWTCLECELASSAGARGEAKALRDRLIEQLRLDFSSAPAPIIAAESQWPGVAGMFELKATLERDLITPLRYPEYAARYRVLPPNGILLYGPPGCGKTFMARKVAEKLGFRFIEIKPSDVGSPYIHGSQIKIAEVFAKAAAEAPTVLFFDEVDSLGGRRDLSSHGAYAQEVNEFLARLDHAAAHRILVIAATNYPDKLDPALLRAGRLEQHYLVGLPDYAARAALFQEHLEKRPKARMSWDELAGASEGYTAADVAHLCEQAARLALGESTKVGREVLINQPHLDAAMRAHRPATVVANHTRIGFRP